MNLDREKLLTRVSQGDLEAFCDASPELQADREIVLAAVTLEGQALAYASGDLQADRHIVLAAVSCDGEALALATEELRSDKEIAMVAVLQTGGALEHVSDSLAGDREIVLAAVSQTGWALSFATEEMRSDREIVLAATAKDPEAIQAAAEVLLEDTSFAIAARQTVYFFKIALLSGRYCTLAVDDEESLEPGYSILSLLLIESCAKLGIEHTGHEVLLHGLDLVPDEALIYDWPGSPSRGAVTEYQLIKPQQPSPNVAPS